MRDWRRHSPHPVLQEDYLVVWRIIVQVGRHRRLGGLRVVRSALTVAADGSKVVLVVVLGVCLVSLRHREPFLVLFRLAGSVLEEQVHIPLRLVRRVVVCLRGGALADVVHDGGVLDVLDLGVAAAIPDLLLRLLEDLGQGALLLAILAHRWVQRLLHCALLIIF